MITPDYDPGIKRYSHVLLLSIFLVIGVFVYWASWAELDQITRATGQVIASSRNQIIQAPEGGVLQEMRVKEGDAVKRGEVLFVFDETRAKAAHQESKAKVAALQAVVARLQAEVFKYDKPKFSGLDEFPEFRQNQLALFKRRREAVNQEIAGLRQTKRLIESELKLNRPLVKSGDVSQAEILKLKRQLTDIQAQINNRRNLYFQEAQAELSKAREELESASQILAQREEQLGFTQVTSPMDGVVRNIRLTTQGGVARPGDEILQIVPVDDDLIVEAKVPPKDIAFLKTGLESTVKMDAYDYSIYGSLQGEVIYISADTLTEETANGTMPYYRVQIRTSTQNLSSKKDQKIDIQPGMTASVDIKTGSQTVLRYLTKPITKTLGEALQER